MARSLIWRLTLISPSPTQYHWHLYLSRRSWDSPQIRVVEQETSVRNSGEVKEKERLITLTRDTVVPRYSIANGPRTKWDVGIGFEGDEPRIYPLRTREDVFLLQQLMTAYEPVRDCEGIRFAWHSNRRSVSTSETRRTLAVGDFNSGSQRRNQLHVDFRPFAPLLPHSTYGTAFRRLADEGLTCSAATTGRYRAVISKSPSPPLFVASS